MHSRSRSRATLFRCLSSHSSSDDFSSKETSPVHLIVLVHGWLGNELEMGYLRHSLERQSGAKGHQVMIHGTVSSVGRTWDGVAAGGLQLGQDVDRVVEDKMQHELSSPLTPSWEFLGRLVCSPCPGTLVVVFQITTQSLLHDGNFPFGSQQACLRQDSPSG
jgi:hypothetical protein